MSSSARYTTEKGKDATSTNQSHATGHSVVPDKLQQKLPRSVEDSVPNAIHDTGAPHQKGRGVSHATGKSYVPEKLQEALPESIERAVPNFIHDTSEKPNKGGNQGKF
ncbi:hypothetical protein BJ508DRAFT_411381 [Ascobolus immersus RN42]|uniref:Uncharacterized protein n=1 Tax=Ascobolus immersus RN42 TaxID=1160509 RepID=A0A3N4ILA0_ASCIM|nr:hypothetical protein BJ508DRAFT_411381 [Ascobolus immersus RN42]